MKQIVVVCLLAALSVVLVSTDDINCKAHKCRPDGNSKTTCRCRLNTRELVRKDNSIEGCQKVCKAINCASGEIVTVKEVGRCDCVGCNPENSIPRCRKDTDCARFCQIASHSIQEVMDNECFPSTDNAKASRCECRYFSHVTYNDSKSLEGYNDFKKAEPICNRAGCGVSYPPFVYVNYEGLVRCDCGLAKEEVIGGDVKNCKKSCKDMGCGEGTAIKGVCQCRNCPGAFIEDCKAKSCSNRCGDRMLLHGKKQCYAAKCSKRCRCIPKDLPMTKCPLYLEIKKRYPSL